MRNHEWLRQNAGRSFEVYEAITARRGKESAQLVAALAGILSAVSVLQDGEGSPVLREQAVASITESLATVCSITGTDHNDIASMAAQIIADSVDIARRAG